MPSRDDLPVPDYDHLPVGSLAHRLRTLDTDALDALRSEQAPTPDGAATQVPVGDQAGTNQPLRHGVAGHTPTRQIRSR